MTLTGITRQWSSFSQAAGEVIDARVYSGIHFRTADEVGARLGRQVARFVSTLELEFFDGQAPASIVFVIDTSTSRRHAKWKNLTVRLQEIPRRHPRRFSDAAEELVNARIYEGIHFRFADEAAREQGRQVADWASKNFLRPLDKHDVDAKDDDDRDGH